MLRHFLFLVELSIEHGGDLVFEGFKLQDVILSTPVPAPHPPLHSYPPAPPPPCLSDDLVITAESAYSRGSADPHLLTGDSQRHNAG